MVPTPSRRRPRHHQLAVGVIYREAEAPGRPIHFYIRPKDDDTDVIVVSCLTKDWTTTQQCSTNESGVKKLKLQGGAGGHGHGLV